MEFGEKVAQLRKQKNLTQEELADLLFVSRAAVSKWESCRGYPNIDSLKALAAFFAVSVDELLSGNESIPLAEEEKIQKESRFLDLFFGLMDCCTACLLFLPLFGQKADGAVHAVSLLTVTGASFFPAAIGYTVVIVMLLLGIAALALQNCRHPIWVKHKRMLSLTCNAAAELLLIGARQPYAAAFLFLFLIIKGFLLFKRH